MKTAFAKKRHEAGAAGFAVFLDTTSGRYVGDVTPTADGWIAHPAGQELRLPFTWPGRAGAAAALKRFAETVDS